jgi:prepilin-type N-terminal cleavage/methylation domain-containing protein
VNRKSGFTLIELLLGLAIMGIVIAVASSFLLFGYRTYGGGSAQYDVQSDIRTTIDFMINDTRNTNEVYIVTVASIPSTNDGYKYLYLEGNAIKYKAASTGFAAVLKSAAIINNAGPVFEITSQSGSFMIVINLSGAANGKSYASDSDVLLKNVKSAITASGNALKYK